MQLAMRKTRDLVSLLKFVCNIPLNEQKQQLPQTLHGLNLKTQVFIHDKPWTIDQRATLR